MGNVFVLIDSHFLTWKVQQIEKEKQEMNWFCNFLQLCNQASASSGQKLLIKKFSAIFCGIISNTKETILTHF